MKKSESELKLRTIEDLTNAHEFVFNKQKNGLIDAKTADGMNTTLKGATYLNGKLRMDAAKLWLHAQIKKVALPAGMLPDMGGRDGEM